MKYPKELLGCAGCGVATAVLCSGAVGVLALGAYGLNRLNSDEALEERVVLAPPPAPTSVLPEGGGKKSRPAVPAKKAEEPKLGIIIDSQLTVEQAMGGNPCQADALFKEVQARQQLLTVLYWGMSEKGEPDGKIHQGQIVVDGSLQGEVETLFQVAFDSRFPFHSLIPVSQFGWHDAASMAANNTSAWNFRGVGSGQSCPKQKPDGTVTGSKHASLQAGTMAIDINDVQNPYCHGGICEPAGSKYDPQVPGTLTRESAVIKVATAARGTEITVPLCSGTEWQCAPSPQTRMGLGLNWGGTWKSPDFQHLDVSR